jgi:hypothetical protein
MTTYRIYRVRPDRGLEFRCSVVSVNEYGAVLRARQRRAVDGRWRLAVVEESAYSEIAPNGDRANL